MSGYSPRKTKKPGSTAPREVKHTFLLVCDDLKTSPIYFRGYNNDYRDSPLKIECPRSGGQDPVNIIKYAKKLLNAEYDWLDLKTKDAVWCVFDRDETSDESIKEVCNMANKKNIKTCFSNPCFEVWYLLHFEDYNTTLGDCRNVITKLKGHIPTYEKNRDFYEVLKPYTLTAVRRAQKLCDNSEKDSDDLLCRNSDPCTQVYLIVKEINKYTGCLKN